MLKGIGEIMNDKDKEAFEKWFSTWNRAEFPSLCMETWQAACEYKQKEIDEIEAKSSVLIEALEKILSHRTCKTHKLGACPSSDENNLYIPAWKALEKYRGEL